MSNAPVLPEDDKELHPEEENLPKPGKAGRIFLTLIVLTLVTISAIFGYLYDQSFVQDLLAQDTWMTRLIANLHPIFSFFPLGLLLLVVLAEIGGWLSFGKWRPATRLPLFLAILIGSLTAVSGFIFMNLEGNTGAGWQQYANYGLGSLTALSLAYLCKIWGKFGNGRGFFYALFLLSGVGAIGYGGYHFGQQVHGYTVTPQDDLGTPFASIRHQENLNRKISALQETESTLRSDLTVKDQSISTLNEEKLTLTTQLQTEQETLATTRETLGNLEKSLTESQAAQEKALADLAQSRLEAQQAQQEAQTLKAQAEDTRKQIQAAEKEAAEAQTQIQKVQDSEKALQEQLKALNEELRTLKTAKPTAEEKADTE